MPELYAGQYWIKQPSNRLAQVTALDPTHAHLQWADNKTRTKIRRNRFGRTTEWKLPIYVDGIDAT